MICPPRTRSGCAGEIEDIIGIDASHAPLISAKQGIGIEEVLEAVVRYIPAPGGDEEQPLQALVFDSYYDSYKGVIVYIRVKEGRLCAGDTIRMMATGAQFEVVELGIMRPGRLEPCDCPEGGTGGLYRGLHQDGERGPGWGYRHAG